MRYIVLIFIVIFYGCKNSNDGRDVIVSEKTELEIPTNGKSGKIINLILGCGYNYTLGKTEIILNQPAYREVEQIRNLLTYSGIPMNFEVFSADISNAAAIIVDNKRYIIYDPRLFSFTDKVANTYWSSMSILAHEIGHHLAGHTLSKSHDSHKSELEADKYSGFLLYKMGATLDEATISVKLLATDLDSDSHPGKIRRLSAIESGWLEASQQRYESAIPPPPNDENNDAEFWGQDEFLIEDLLPKRVLINPAFGGGIYDEKSYLRKLYEDDSDFLEGIIIDVQRDDPSGGRFAEYFEEAPTNYNVQLTLHLTSKGNSEYGENVKVGDRMKFYLLEYGQMNNAYLSALEAILVPGRKIRIKSYYFGYGASQIIYLKKIKR